jgi:hypothetical protein
MMRGERRRASRGNTHEPFDCCGKEAGPYGRPKGTICRECRTLIEEGKAARERIDKGLAPYVWTSTDYGWPQFYGTGADLPSDVHKALALAFWTLANRITVPAPADTPTSSPVLGEPDRRTGERRPLPWPRLLSVSGLSHDSWSWATFVLGNPDTVEALDNLHRGIRVALGAAYDRGRKLGGNALMRLAEGSLALDDFDATISGKDGRR